MSVRSRTYNLWALFNYDRPPIYVQTTRRECVRKGINWLGGEREFRKARREGSITIEKVVLRRPSTGSQRKEK